MLSLARQEVQLHLHVGELYNSHGYPTKALEFVQTPDDELDADYSLQLKKEALAEGSQAAAVDFLR